ncbi:MAG: hypothetical protein HN978_08830 [Desulfobacula sp.]|nr:hypothetical protein [Desulfobacula sp.]
MIGSYSKRYGCSMVDAQTELMKIGYYDEIYIQSYEKNEVIKDALRKEMKLVLRINPS